MNELPFFYFIVDEKHLYFQATNEKPYSKGDFGSVAMPEIQEYGNTYLNGDATKKSFKAIKTKNRRKIINFIRCLDSIL